MCHQSAATNASVTRLWKKKIEKMENLTRVKSKCARYDLTD